MYSSNFTMMELLTSNICNCYFWFTLLSLVFLIYKTFDSFYIKQKFMKTKYRTRGHTWRSILCNKSIPYNTHCKNCNKLMLTQFGLFCECCALSACRKCFRKVDKKFCCKSICWPEDKPFYHHWVNVGLGEEHFDSITEDLKRFFCCWCHQTKLCYENTLNPTQKCDFKKYKNFIIPPTHVQVENGAVVDIKPLHDNDWTPLFVFANKKSGSSRSDELLSLFRGLLNPIQVIDLSETKPEGVVQWMPPRSRVLVAGGDGTVSWILGALHNAPHLHAAVGIVPMGTGNDLSRALGWGAGCPQELDASALITDVAGATERPLDAWRVRICPAGGARLGRARGERVLLAHNYASVGVDARVALDFHRARSQFLYKYASRTLNYLAYLWLGATRVVDDGGCEGLERRLKVRLEPGGELDLPPIQALLLLNIPSWGAGVDLWSMGSDYVPPQNMSDGKLEVVGISSSFHIARLQCGLAEPFRFVQASKVKIELEGCCAMQVDGEPWMQGPATIHIEPAGQSLVLIRN